MNYVPATHQSRRQNTEDRKQNVEYRIILNSDFWILNSFWLYLLPSRARKTTHISFIRGSESTDTSQHGPKRNQPHLYQINCFYVKDNPARLPLFFDEIVQMRNLFTQIDRFSKTLIL